MPLRDHFRPPLDDRTSWDGFHGQWPAMIVVELSRKLPRRYVAAPNIHLGSGIEDERDEWEEVSSSDLPDPDEYEVRVYDERRGRQLVAAVEIVSPSNKDRPEHRRAFVAKCSGLLRAGVCVVIVDLVTTRSANLHGELMAFLGLDAPSLVGEFSHLSAVACRWVKGENGRILETWAYPLALGQGLPTLPLWVAGNRAVPLDLESSYETTCRVLRIA